MAIIYKNASYGGVNVVNYTAAPDYANAIDITDVVRDLGTNVYTPRDNGFILFEGILNNSTTNGDAVLEYKPDEGGSFQIYRQPLAKGTHTFQVSVTAALNYTISVKDGAGSNAITADSSVYFVPFSSNIPINIDEGFPPDKLLGAVPVNKGGTGATTAAGALQSLGADNRYLKLTGGTLTGNLIAQSLTAKRANSAVVALTSAEDNSSTGYIQYYYSNGTPYLQLLNYAYNPDTGTNSNRGQIIIQDSSLHITSMGKGTGINTAPDRNYTLKVGGKTLITDILEVTNLIRANGGISSSGMTYVGDNARVQFWRETGGWIPTIRASAVGNSNTNRQLTINIPSSCGITLTAEEKNIAISADGGVGIGGTPDATQSLKVYGDTTVTGIITTTTPATTSNDTTVATTSWVTDKVNAKADSSVLANYLPLTGGVLTGDLTGTRAIFSNTITASTPLPTSDDNTLATTAWVNRKLNTGFTTLKLGNGTLYTNVAGDLHFRNDITGVSTQLTAPQGGDTPIPVDPITNSFGGDSYMEETITVPTGYTLFEITVTSNTGGALTVYLNDSEVYSISEQSSTINAQIPVSSGTLRFTFEDYSQTNIQITTTLS